MQSLGPGLAVGKPAEREELDAYINGQHVVFKGLAQFLHDLYLSIGTSVNGTLHRDRSLWVIYAQIL